MKKYKLGLIIILVFAVAAIVTAVLIKRHYAAIPKESECETEGATTCKVDLQDAATTQTTKTTVGSFGDQQKITNNIYKNDKFKFQITFPESWKEAKVQETIPFKSSEGAIEFQLPTTDKTYSSGYASALILTFYKKSAYSPISSFEMKLAENTEYIVTYRSWEQPPSDAKITEKEVANIAATLKFTN